MEKQTITAVVIDAVQDYLESQEDDGAQVSVQESTVLFGGDAALDSLGLVSVIVDIELRFRDQGFDEFTLTSGEIITRTDSPFRTVSTLVDFIAELTS
jgi:acyl carrier protein